MGGGEFPLLRARWGRLCSLSHATVRYMLYDTTPTPCYLDYLPLYAGAMHTGAAGGGDAVCTNRTTASGAGGTAGTVAFAPFSVVGQPTNTSDFA